MRGQPTSAIALAQAEGSGKLNGRRFEVAKAFKEHGPGTSAEVLHRAGLAKNLNLMRARVTELADDGFLREIGERRCNVTRRLAIVWEYGSFPPRKAVKTPSATKDELHAALAVALTIAETALKHDDMALNAVTGTGILDEEEERDWIAESMDVLNEIRVDFFGSAPKAEAPSPQDGAA
jgi:chloramphenicol 3-O-phosphotransferase